MAVLQREWKEEWGNIDAVDIHVFDLPFHPNAPLIELQPRSSAVTGRLYFLLQGDTLYRLNGASPPIHAVNGNEKPRIDEETILHYLAFFCFFVRGEKGPFLIVDRPENGFLPDLGERSGDIAKIFRPPQVWGKNEQGYWLVSGLVYYANAVFVADFSVQPGGAIEMVGDTPVLADLRRRNRCPSRDPIAALTAGRVPRLGTYLRPETPNPLLVRRQRGVCDLRTILRDGIGLTKINFNPCLHNARLPVTIRFADEFGKVLLAGLQTGETFKFHI